MEFLLLLLLVGSASAKCNGVYINQKYYNVNIIKEGLNKIHQIVFNRNDNTAYFTFELLETFSPRVLGYLKLDGLEAGIINGVRNATGLAMDQNLNRLYVGGADGLFMINFNKNKVPEKMPVNENIQSLFLKDNVVYYITRHNKAFRFHFGYIDPIFEVQDYAVEKLIIDDDDNIIFLERNKLYKVKLGTKIVNSLENTDVNDITTDSKFKPYVCAKNGLYVYNKYKYVLDKVAELRDIKKLTFVTDEEPIYVVVDKIVKLVRNPVACFGD